MWNPFKPKIENSDPGQRSLQLISQKGMPFAYVEAYKSLRTNLNFLTSSTGARAIVVTSTLPEEAKSNVSVNLALTLAEDGKNVALVDCDLRKPVLHKYLKAGHNVKGVSNIVSNQCKLEEALLRLEQLKITFLPAGTPPPNPSELLGSARMQQMIQQLRATFDYVIFDAPPISMVTDAAVIGNQVDGALFVVRSSYAPAESVEAAVKKLKDTGVKVLGAVLTRYDAKTALKGCKIVLRLCVQTDGSCFPVKFCVDDGKALQRLRQILRQRKARKSESTQSQPKG